MDCSSSLKELLSKLCLESNKKYKIDSTDVTASGGDSKLRQLSLVIYYMEHCWAMSLQGGGGAPPLKGN